MKKYTSVNEYLAAQPAKERTALQNLRKIIKKTAPNAEELISYGMPAYRYHGMLVFFAAFKNHLTFFVGDGVIVGEIKSKLKNYETTKGGIHFTPQKPFPESLVMKIVKTRMKKNLQKSKLKRKGD